MIENNIISSLGAGSGIDTRGLVDQLTEIERAPRQNSIDTRRDRAEAQISDIGLLRSSLSTLKESVDLLGDESFGAMSASFTDSTALTPTELGDDAPPGDYTFEVLAVAQAQSLSTGALFNDPSDAVGKGTLTLDFGDWDATTDNFTINGDKPALNITIDDSNNSLTGLRDAINDADAGVQASIIQDGAGYRLLLKAPSGEDNQMRITVAEEGGSPTNVDGNDLSRFAFGAGAVNQQMVQNQAGVDASLKMNGFTFTRESNVIDDVVEDFTFTLNKASPGELINITISEDKLAAENAVRDFVQAYNDFLTAIEPAVGSVEEEDEDGNSVTRDGSLRRDATARSMLSQIRSEIASAVPGLDGGFTTLGTIGIRTELDGSMTIDEDTFTGAFEDNFDLVQNLFAPQTSSTSDKIEVTGFGDQTVPGTYNVAITQEPARGGLVGTAAAGTLLADLTTVPTKGDFTGAASAFASTDLSGATSGDYAFDIAVDGGTAVTITLPPANYADENAIATALQAEFDSNSVAADIAHDGTKFVVTSRAAGSHSAVAITNVQELTPGEFGLAAGSATSGTGPNYDFKVTVDGTTSGTISLTPGTYADHDALAAHIQSQINGDETLKANGADVDVVWNVDHFEITSRAYGAKSNVTVTDMGPNTSDLGLSSGTSTAGTNVAGTIDGVAGFGVGNVLLPELNSDPHGLSFLVKAGASTAPGSVNFSRGFAGELSQLIDSFLQSNGTFDQKEDSLESRLEDLDEDQERLDRRMEAFHERQIQQFIAMERILGGLSTSGDFLDGLGDRLPNTASNN